MRKNIIPNPDFKTLCGLFNKHKVKYVVIGGWAGIIYGLSRTTRDVDILIDRSPKNCQNLLKALEKIGAGIARELTPEEILSKKVFIQEKELLILKV
ncbi:MAG: hypothetical protein AB1633_00575 [Elusimicrobiota bacterium]